MPWAIGQWPRLDSSRLVPAIMSTIETVSWLTFGVTMYLPSVLIHGACGSAGFVPGGARLIVLISLVAPGENTWIWLPPLITTSTLSLPTSVMTWDGLGPTGTVRTNFPVFSSNTSSRLPHHSVWYTSLPATSVHMLC